MDKLKTCWDAAGKKEPGNEWADRVGSQDSWLSHIPPRAPSWSCGLESDT